MIFVLSDDFLLERETDDCRNRNGIELFVASLMSHWELLLSFGCWLIPHMLVHLCLSRTFRETKLKYTSICNIQFSLLPAVVANCVDCKCCPEFVAGSSFLAK